MKDIELSSEVCQIQYLCIIITVKVAYICSCHAYAEEMLHNVYQ